MADDPRYHWKLACWLADNAPSHIVGCWNGLLEQHDEALAAAEARATEAERDAAYWRESWSKASAVIDESLPAITERVKATAAERDAAVTRANTLAKLRDDIGAFANSHSGSDGHDVLLAALYRIGSECEQSALGEARDG